MVRRRALNLACLVVTVIAIMYFRTCACMHVASLDHANAGSVGARLGPLYASSIEIWALAAASFSASQGAYSYPACVRRPTSRSSSLLVLLDGWQAATIIGSLCALIPWTFNLCFSSSQISYPKVSLLLLLKEIGHRQVLLLHSTTI